MKAIVYTRYGPPNVLRLQEVEKPTPEDGEVLVRVRAASVNSWDWDLVRGTPFYVRIFGGGLLKPKKKILGAHKPNKDLAYLIELFKVGKVVPIVDRCFPLRETPDALRYFGTGRVQGNVVITV